MRSFRGLRLLTACWFLFAGSWSGRAAELPREPILRIDAGRHTQTVTRISADRQGRWLVSSSQDKTVRVWDAATGRMERVLRPPIGEGQEGELFGVAISPDGSLVACGGWTQSGSAQEFSVYLFSRADGRLVGRIQGLPNTIGHLAFSPDGSVLAVAVESKGVRLFAVDRRAVEGNPNSVTVSVRSIAEDRNYAGASDWVSFSPDGRWLVTSAHDGYVRLYNLEALDRSSKRSKNINPVARQKLPGGGLPHSVVFSPDGASVAVGFHHLPSVNVLSASDLHFVYAPDISGITNGDLSSVSWSSDGQYLFAGGLYATPSGVPVRRWAAAGRGTPADLAAGATNSIMDLVPLPDGNLALGAAGPTLAVLGPDGNRKWLVGPSIADFRKGVLWLSQDGTVVSFGYNAQGSSPATFSLIDRSLTTGSSAITARKNLSLAPPVRSTPGLDIQGWADTPSPTLNGRRLALKPFELSLSLAIAPDSRSFLLGTEWYLRRFGRDGREIWNVAVPGAAWAVNIAGNGSVAVAACADGTIRWYRYSDGKEVTSFFPHADQRRWVVWTPSGYYDASPGGEELIGWNVNNGSDHAADFYPASRFRRMKYRPDVVSKIPATLDETKAVRLADAETRRETETTTIAQALPPVVGITAPEDGSQVSATSVTLHYTVRTPSGEPATGLQVFVDGRPVSTSRGVTLVANEDEGQTLTVTIPARNCEVSLIASNRYSASVPATIHLVWSSAAPPQQFVAKPVLYLLAVGVSNYQNPEYRLHFAAKDAKDFAAAMEAQKGGLYRDVQVKLLTDAPKDQIEDGLDWLQHQVTSLDVGMIFLSGHGLDDANSFYYFLPANADLNRLKATCLAFSDLKSTVASIAGKAVMFVDTCHSGDVLGARRGVADINAVVNELSAAENGVVVFTASTGRQYSLEDPKWQNGAFTKALVEGIDGKADYTGRGEITINMLDLYLAERVKELTDGQQTPATAKPSTVPDFPLAVKP
ncbi:MAG TPA: caspase family protein [Terriglobia bacterium]